MAPPQMGLRTSNCSLLLIYLLQKDERLGRPGWLTYSGRFTHISGHPSAADRAQDSESSPVKDQRSATVPRNQQAAICGWGWDSPRAAYWPGVFIAALLCLGHMRRESVFFSVIWSRCIRFSDCSLPLRLSFRSNCSWLKVTTQTLS